MNRYQKKERQLVWKQIEKYGLSPYDYCKVRQFVRMSKRFEKILFKKVKLYPYQRLLLKEKLDLI